MISVGDDFSTPGMPKAFTVLVNDQYVHWGSKQLWDRLYVKTSCCNTCMYTCILYAAVSSVYWVFAFAPSFSGTRVFHSPQKPTFRNSRATSKYLFIYLHGSDNLEKVMNFTSRLEKSLNSVQALEQYLTILLGLEKSLKFTTLSTLGFFLSVKLHYFTDANLAHPRCKNL